MKTHKVTQALYTDKKGKRCRGLWLLNRKTNTVALLDKNFNKIDYMSCSNIVTQEYTEGAIWFDLSRH